MKFRLPQSLYTYYQTEINHYRAALKQNNLPQSWRHLERAHIIGQAYPLPHTQVHWLMLCFGWRTRNVKEVIGQIIRMLLGFFGSAVGKIPVGNTGGTNVPMTQSMPIPADLQKILSRKQ